MSFGFISTAFGSMEAEFMIFYDSYIILTFKTACAFYINFSLRFGTLSIDNEREHVCRHSCKDMDVYKRALYRCHMICTKLSFSISMSITAIASRYLKDFARVPMRKLHK